jgi:hypothetical protein
LLLIADHVRRSAWTGGRRSALTTTPSGEADGPTLEPAMSLLARCTSGLLLLLLTLVPLVAADAGQPSWILPAGWSKLDAEKPMRVATFKAGADATAVEVAVSVFPKDVGGLLGNVNRWRRQVMLPPIAEADLAANVTPFQVPGFSGNTTRCKGEAQHLLAAALYEVAADRTWFVKIQGTPAAIDAQEAAFMSFVKSFAPAK